MADTSHPSKIKVNPPSTIYTGLLIIATLFLVLGTAILAWKSQQIFGNWLPFLK